MARLSIYQAGVTRAVELGDRTTLGRIETNTIQIEDVRVSKLHCTIERRGDVFVLRDVSQNGTRLNGARMPPEVVLSHGDVFEFGDASIRFETAAARGGGTEVMGSLPGPTGTVPLDELPSFFGPLPPEPEAPKLVKEVTAVMRGFAPAEKLRSDVGALSADYERLRLAHELSQSIALERDTEELLRKIVRSTLALTGADRGTILLPDGVAAFSPRVEERQDGASGSITISRTILRHVITTRAAVLTKDAAADFVGAGLDLGHSLVAQNIGSAVVAPLLARETKDVLGVLWLDAGRRGHFRPSDLEVAVSIAHQAATFLQMDAMSRKLRDEAVQRDRLCRLLSPKVAERVMTGELDVAPGGVLVPECTVFFSDIRGFTQMSEDARPEAIVEMLNEYFALMVELVFQYDGTLDKLMGDGLMALWGAPASHPDDAVRAVACALEMGRALEGFNAARVARGAEPLEIGIGIHTGPLVAGYVGSPKTLSYTVIGDVANTCARLCSMARPRQVLVTDAVVAKVSRFYRTKHLDDVTVKGRNRALSVHEVLGVA